MLLKIILVVTSIYMVSLENLENESFEITASRNKADTWNGLF